MVSFLKDIVPLTSIPPTIVAEAIDIRKEGRDLLATYGESGSGSAFFRNSGLWNNRVSKFLSMHGAQLDSTHMGLVTELGNIVEAVGKARQEFDPRIGGWFQKAFEVINATTLGREVTTQTINLGDELDITKAGSLFQSCRCGITPNSVPSEKLVHSRIHSSIWRSTDGQCQAPPYRCHYPGIRCAFVRAPIRHGPHPSDG